MIFHIILLSVLTLLNIHNSVAKYTEGEYGVAVASGVLAVFCVFAVLLACVFHIEKKLKIE